MVAAAGKIDYFILRQVHHHGLGILIRRRRFTPSTTTPISGEDGQDQRTSSTDQTLLRFNRRGAVRATISRTSLQGANFTVTAKRILIRAISPAQWEQT